MIIMGFMDKEVNKLDKYLDNIISGSKFQRLFILHKSNIIIKRKQYIRYSRKYLIRYRIFLIRLFPSKKYIIIKLF